MTDRSLHVLSIDDDPTQGVILRRMLQLCTDWDAVLTSASSSSEGLGALSRQEVDLVLLDYELGAESGLTLMRAIREAGYGVPIVFLTGQGDEELVLEALRAGAADYLPKASLSPNSLRRTIRNAVERQRLEGLVREHQEVLRQTNTDLERRNSEITRFYHTLSHELKTPLTSAVEFLAIVLDEIAGPVTDDQREYLGIARAALMDMARNIEDLVDATRLDTGKLRLEAELHDLGEVVATAVASLGPRAKRAGIALGCEVAAGLPRVTVDENRVAQVVRNLVTNALKFTPEGGEVAVEVRQANEPGQPLEVLVHDTGRGIPAEHLPRIFDRLHQVRDDDFVTVGGLGLGLNICRELVQLHGGQIDVESTPGQRTTFRFTIPSTSPADAPRTPDEVPQS